MPNRAVQRALYRAQTILDKTAYFYNYGNMERAAEVRSGLALTDAVLEELKTQAPEGCLLCVLSALDEEDWD